MQDAYFGIKELYEVVLKAKTPMRFGDRTLETGESILYFEKVNMAVLSEKNNVIMARGGWSNMPRVIWEDRSEVQFSLTEGVMNNTSMGILLSTNAVHTNDLQEPILVQKTEGPRRLIFEKENLNDLTAEDNNDNNYLFYLEHWPVEPEVRKGFIYQFNNDTIQKKVYGDRVSGKINFEGNERPCIKIYEDKEENQYVFYIYMEQGVEHLLTVTPLATSDGKGHPDCHLPHPKTVQQLQNSLRLFGIEDIIRV